MPELIISLFSSPPGTTQPMPSHAQLPLPHSLNEPCPPRTPHVPREVPSLADSSLHPAHVGDPTPPLLVLSITAAGEATHALFHAQQPISCTVVTPSCSFPPPHRHQCFTSISGLRRKNSTRPESSLANSWSLGARGQKGALFWSVHQGQSVHQGRGTLVSTVNLA